MRSAQAHPLAGKRIIICGAGIGGLAFAIALRKSWYSTERCRLGSPPEIVIYEREELQQANREGYSMSIRSDKSTGGLQVLQRLGILDEVLDVSITGREPDAGHFHIWDKDWKTLLRIKAQPVHGLPVLSMRIARKNLRLALIESLHDPSIIHWGTKCEGARQLDNGRIQVQLAGGTDICDLLVVADGAGSKIRSCLRPDDNLSYAGVVSIGATAEFSEKSIPAPADSDWGIVVSGRGTALFVSPVDESRALWNISYTSPEPRQPGKEPRSAEAIQELLAEALNRGSLLPEPFQTLVRATDTSTLHVMNAMDKQPIPHIPAKTGGQIVFIGDSSHAVSPFAGMTDQTGWFYV